MTTGYSGSYGINGTDLTLQPSEGHWLGRDELGLDGSGRPIYPAIRDFELTWGLMTPAELQQLINFQLSVSNSGTAVVDLPKWNDAGYLFYSYSGTTLKEPTVGTFFNQYYTDVTLIVTSVRTN